MTTAERITLLRPGRVESVTEGTEKGQRRAARVRRLARHPGRPRSDGLAAAAGRTAGEGRDGPLLGERRTCTETQGDGNGGDREDGRETTTHGGTPVKQRAEVVTAMMTARTVCCLPFTCIQQSG
ncbi:hypothetical protein CBZ_27840 [Cellulomonas biazotea]|uniref:Uncharacterized protein n=1 Tax=Cellulomonas biazotea TaxID=1709 RepID=A0A402DUF4_9CELL|nr:hypothetical protein CBZ_27840 [Cellulomonas biazotea]